MFWGLNLKSNRKYSQTAIKSFHIAQAALDISSSQDDGGANQIFIIYESQKFLICTLRKDACEQVMLDLNFAQGDEICFQSVGTGNVCLSGYLIDDDDNMDDFMNGDDDEEEESELEIEGDLRNALNKKAKAKKESGKERASKTAAKAKANEEDEDDDDEEDSDFNAEDAVAALMQEEADSDDDDEEEEDDDEEDESEDEEEEDESEDEEVQQPKAKQPKLEKPQKQQNGVAKENAAATEKKGKKDKKAKKENQEQQKPQQQQQKSGGERTLSGGVKVEDIRVGNGPEAKTGKRAQVYYEGRLKSNNKVFDSLKQGAGLKFGVGRGEVIKGWDVGVVGMKVGGKRRITCPAHMAYGARGSPPTIPPNSTLVFEVELKSVN